MKTETLKEFLARGGKITVVESTTEEVKQTLKQNNQGPPSILTYDDIDLYYGEKRVSKKRSPVKSNDSKIDINALPEELRKKFFNVEGQKEAEDEDEE
jgi:hypothetical protein